MAPEPRDVSWRNLVIPYKILPLCKLGVIVAASLLTVFFAIPVIAVQGIAKFEKIKRWFPPAVALQLIPGLSSFITGYLPSAILKGFIYIVPFAMLGLGSFCSTCFFDSFLYKVAEASHHFLAAQFEICQLNLTGARKILGNAIGKAPKDKIFKKYIEIELQLANIDRCRTIYEKYLEWAPHNCYAWTKYAEL